MKANPTIIDGRIYRGVRPSYNPELPYFAHCQTTGRSPKLAGPFRTFLEAAQAFDAFHRERGTMRYADGKIFRYNFPQGAEAGLNDPPRKRGPARKRRRSWRDRDPNASPESIPFTARGLDQKDRAEIERNIAEVRAEKDAAGLRDMRGVLPWCVPGTRQFNGYHERGQGVRS